LLLPDPDEVAMHLKISSHRPFGRDFLERQFWLLLTVIAFVFMATIVARADEKDIRIGLQFRESLDCGAFGRGAVGAWIRDNTDAAVEFVPPAVIQDAVKAGS
jgi:hypothetical protein